MGILGKIFTWWDGATIGTSLYSARNGAKVGEDHLGNVYYKGKDDRRWVIYNGPNDASRVPAEWHGWLHHTFDEEPESFLPPPRIWEKESTPNLTGTAQAYRPKGALEQGGRRAQATGDYEAWSPDAS
ncbi:MAG: NADH:ubiquinone oxidoreductase subunit NDUFA12 [Alphaproteobacteria bacterium]|nr:NADH:ubiquinone oxidoreductase subunit NDUFA12 [Alphaproteobacteria bacterium]